MVTCADCSAPMSLRDSRHGKFYGCTRYPECKGTHGAHADGRPLGVPANSATKQARIRAHAAFDVLWKSGEMSRTKAYRWLAQKLGVAEIHMGESNEATCERIIEVCTRRADEAKETR